MSTTFSTIYDELRTLIDSTLSSYDEINNPYFISDDADINYDNGWALSIGAAENSNKNICPKLGIRRDFVLTIIDKSYATFSDVDARVEAEKSILNTQLDALAVLTLFTSDTIITVDYLTDNGIEFLGGEDFGILFVQTLLSVEYVENL